MVADSEVYEPTNTERLSQTVVRAVADSKGVDPMELNERLYDVIDPDALDALFAGNGELGSGRVSFSLADRRVVVDQARRVYVSAQDAEGAEASAALDPTTLRDTESRWSLVF